MKQETLEEVAEKLKGKELFNESNDRARKILSEIKSLPIQETLEEAIHRYAQKGSWQCPVSFEAGAKWQQERTYNEKELYSEIEWLIISWNNDGTKTAGHLTRQIIEQLRKK
jgi:hypothetical protein